MITQLNNELVFKAFEFHKKVFFCFCGFHLILFLISFLAPVNDITKWRCGLKLSRAQSTIKYNLILLYKTAQQKCFKRLRCLCKGGFVSLLSIK